MSEDYHEILGGEVTPRRAPGARHELICNRLHAAMAACVAGRPGTRLLPARTLIRLSADTHVCPDLALINAATGQLWLAVEIVSAEDHRTDTVVKKQIYEDIRVPRLWMVDPRYDNVEVYHNTEYGLKLMGILAGREVLTEQELPDFALVVAELFATPRPGN